MARITDTEVRKTPVQERSKARVENILKSSEKLLTKFGYAELKVSDVAKEAGVPIGSVYQYFGSKAAIYRTLIERYLEKLNAEMSLALEQNAPSDTDSVVDVLVDTVFQFGKKHRAFTPLWITAQSDKTLRDVDINDSWNTSAELATELTALFSEKDAQRIHRMIFLVCDLAGRWMSLIFHESKMSNDELVSEFKALTKAYFKTTQ